MQFKFWKTAGGKSPPLIYITNIQIKNKNRKKDRDDCESQNEIISELEDVEKAGFSNSLKSRAFKPITKKGKEPLYQINKGRHRIVFVMRGQIGHICEAFLKKNDSEEQRRYISVYRRAKIIK